MPNIYFTPEQLPYKPPTFADMTDQRRGRLLMLCVVGKYYAPSNTENWALLWKCVCDCGNTVVIKSWNLNKGTKSCGCLFRDAITKHGRSYTRTYNIWQNMRGRVKHNRNYTKKGIQVCSRWARFENFYADMGDPPDETYSLDRYPNKRGNYEPGNVRWATSEMQNANKDNTVEVTAFGRTLSMAQWAKLSGINYATLGHRVRHGWTPEDALTIQPNRKPRKGHYRLRPSATPHS